MSDAIGLADLARVHMAPTNKFRASLREMYAGHGSEMKKTEHVIDKFVPSIPSRFTIELLIFRPKFWRGPS